MISGDSCEDELIPESVSGLMIPAELTIIPWQIMDIQGYSGRVLEAPKANVHDYTEGRYYEHQIPAPR